MKDLGLRRNLYRYTQDGGKAWVTVKESPAMAGFRKCQATIVWVLQQPLIFGPWRPGDALQLSFKGTSPDLARDGFNLERYPLRQQLKAVALYLLRIVVSYTKSWWRVWIDYRGESEVHEARELPADEPRREDEEAEP